MDKPHFMCFGETASSGGVHAADFSPPRPLFGNPHIDGAAVDQLHGHEDQTSLVAHVMHRQDVRMVDPRQGSPFAQEPLLGQLIVDAALLRPQDLERKLPIELGIPRAIHHTHGACAEPLDQLIAPEGLACEPLDVHHRRRAPRVAAIVAHRFGNRAPTVAALVQVELEQLALIGGQTSPGKSHEMIRFRARHIGYYPGMSDLTKAFYRGRDGAEAGAKVDSASLSQVLERAWNIARGAHPSFAVDAELFCSYLGVHIDPEDIETAAVADLYLCCACLAGDASAVASFQRLVIEQVASAVRRYCDPPDDILQQVNEKLLVGRNGGPAHLGDYAGSGPLKTWVRVIAVREAISDRRKKRDPLVEDEVLWAEASPELAPELALHRQRASREIKQAFQEAMAELEPRERLMLRQHLVDGLTIDELGAVYGVHRVTAARWLRKARGNLWQGTRRRLRSRLSLGGETIDGLLADVRSTLDLSIERVLAD
jgi:RNA polymerase sigma-70 factor (ECF subfamily)